VLSLGDVPLKGDKTQGLGGKKACVGGEIKCSEEKTGRSSEKHYLEFCRRTDRTLGQERRPAGGVCGKMLSG